MEAARSLTASEVIARTRAERVREARAAANQLALALEWARLHPVGEGGAAAGYGEVDLHGEQTIPLAGPGAPLVAEFAPVELAVALGIGKDAGRALLGDALELAHRLPRLWALVQELRVPAWRARGIAQLTRDLSVEAAAFADRLVCADPTHLSRVRAAQLVDEARLYFDPDRAAADEEADAAHRGVWLGKTGRPGSTDVHMRLDTLDAKHLDDTLADVAQGLKRLGDTGSFDARRAKAAGVLADPQGALDLLAGHAGPAGDGDGSPEEPDGPAGPDSAVATFPETAGTVRRRPAVLHLHVGTDDLVRGTGGTVEGLGAATLALLRQWLGRCDVRVAPVLDLARDDVLDRHDPASWLRELCRLRDATCVFPHCAIDSRACDLDHITEYVPPAEGGPPGQTSPHNLAPLCRTHHRLKTHTAWTYQRTGENSYRWTSPTGEQHITRTRRRRPFTPR